MKKIVAFLNNMDSRAWRTVWVSIALLVGVGAIVALGKSGLFVDEVELWLEGLRNSPWALPAVILIFVIAGLIVPLFLLAGACVLAFGPWVGFLYAMLGTVVSSWLQFYFGRWGGAGLLKRYGGDKVHRLSRFIGRNDFLASMIVRNVPVAPAIVVNVAFGASHASFWRFFAGMTLGSIPKVAIVALLGQSVNSALGGGVALGIGAALAVIGIWVTVALAARKAVRGDDKDGDEEEAPAPGPAVEGDMATEVGTKASEGKS